MENYKENSKENHNESRNNKRDRKLNLHLIFNDVSGFYRILAVVFTMFTIVGVALHIKYTIPHRQELKQNLTHKASYKSQIKSLDTQIQQQNQKALTHYMQQYFTKDQLSEMLQQYTTYEIKINGEKITASNIKYNTAKAEVEIEVSAQFNDHIYPEELFDENCPLRISPDGNEIAEIISIHTTKAKYTFETENSGKKHTYRYKITQLAPGEVVTLQINEPKIRAALNPAITKLEVTRSR